MKTENFVERMEDVRNDDEVKNEESKVKEVVEGPSAVAQLQKRRISVDSHSPQKKSCVESVFEKEKTPLTCSECKRRLKITNNYGCRCGNMYCIRHRFHDQHSCTFDYKAVAIAKLEAQNPKVIGKRIGDFQ